MQAPTAREALYRRRQKQHVSAGTSVVDGSAEAPYTVEWMPALPASATRWSFMSRASRCSPAARAFPQERLSAWPAMPAAW